MALVLYYTTLASIDDGKKLGKKLLSSKFAVCINILPNIHSMYIDDGELQESGEVVLLAKVHKSKADDALRFIENEHPYDTPVILTLSASCNKKYENWMLNQLT